MTEKSTIVYTSRIEMTEKSTIVYASRIEITKKSIIHGSLMLMTKKSMQQTIFLIVLLPPFRIILKLQGILSCHSCLFFFQKSLAHHEIVFFLIMG